MIDKLDREKIAIAVLLAGKAVAPDWKPEPGGSVGVVYTNRPGRIWGDDVAPEHRVPSALQIVFTEGDIRMAEFLASTSKPLMEQIRRLIESIRDSRRTPA